MKRLFLTLFFLISIANSAISQTFNTRKTDAFIEYIEANERAIGNVSIFKNGKEIYQRKFGDQEMNRSNDAYRIASVTKLITATLILKLIEEEKLSLNDSLVNYFPEIKQSNKITIEQMLNHTSGLGDVNFRGKDPYWLQYRVYSPSELLQNIVIEELLFEPGTDVSYSNSAYFLLGQILEKKYALPYSEIINQNITKPLNLKTLKAGTDERNNIYPSLKYKNGNWDIMTEKFYENSLAFGDITASTNDLNIFINALFDGKIISNKSLEMMKPKANADFGLGMMKTPFYEISFLGHNGDISGSHTLLGYNEKDKTSIAININGNRNVKNDFYIGILNSLYDAKIPYPIYLNDKILNQYVGTYKCENYPFPIKIYNDGGDLFGLGLDEGQIPFQLKVQDETHFTFHNLSATFIPEECKMIFIENDEVYTFYNPDLK